MATYPYTSGQGAITAAFQQLRSNFPNKVDAGFLQRFNIARSNESYVLSILRFIGLIDDEGKPVDAKTGMFYGDEAAFQKGMNDALRDAYSQLFNEMGEGAFTADRAQLTQWFRAADRTSDLVGQRQASTFLTLAALAGHGEVPAPARSSPAKKPATTILPAKKAPAKKVPAAAQTPPPEVRVDPAAHPVGLSVRIEVNLPAGGDAETYDSIFASIRKHLMS